MDAALDDDRVVRVSDLRDFSREMRWFLLKILAGERRIIMDQAALDAEITNDLAPALTNLKTFVLALEAKIAAAPPTQPISTLDLSSEIEQLHAFADAANALDAPAPAAPVVSEPAPEPAPADPAPVSTSEPAPATTTDAPASTETAATTAEPTPAAPAEAAAPAS